MSTIVETLEQGLSAHKAGDLREAEQRYLQVLATNPRNANALNLMGLVRVQQGRLEEAIESLRDATRYAEGHAEFHRNLGNTLRRAGRPAEAIPSLKRAAELDPESVPTSFDVANALREAGRTRESMEQLRSMLAKNPRNYSAMVNLAGMLADEMRYTEARRLLETALRAHPGLHEARVNLGRVLVEQSQPRLAEQVLSEAVRTRPDDPIARMNMARAMLNQGMASSALTHIDEAARLLPNDPLVRVNRAAILRAKRRGEESNAEYEHAISLAPDNVAALFGMVYNLERQGQLDDAMVLAERAIALNPVHVLCNMLAARIDRRQKRLEQARARIESLIERVGGNMSKEVAGAVHCEYGHILDAIGDYDLAFAEIARGQELLRQAGEEDNDFGAFLRVVDYFREKTTPEVVSPWESRIPAQPGPAEPPPPIFFVGFPRSGTTLTETMLGAHPALVTTDELPILERVMDLIPGMIGKQVNVIEGLGELRADEVGSLRRQYHRYAEKMLETEEIGGRQIVDKYPFNLIRLPVVRRIFPESKVIVGLRDPRDVCISCFFQTFQRNVAMIHFYSIETTARLYASTMDAWLKFRDMLGLNWFESRYEDLVEDTEGQARRLIDFLGLEWDASVLDHTKRGEGRMITTPSYIGVGQPIYKQSKQRWRKYEKQLEPVMPILEPYLKAFGYE